MLLVLFTVRLPLIPMHLLSLVCCKLYMFNDYRHPSSGAVYSFSLVDYYFLANGENVLHLSLIEWRSYIGEWAGRPV
jgi:hypothetical protein